MTYQIFSCRFVVIGLCSYCAHTFCLAGAINIHADVMFIFYKFNPKPAFVNACVCVWFDYLFLHLFNLDNNCYGSSDASLGFD